MELKEFEVGLGQMFEDGSPVVIAVDENNNPRLLGKEKVYLKSEADKVFAELKADYKEACDRLQTANLIKDEQLAAARHQKYKRCFAMAGWCEATALWCYQAAHTLPTGFHATLFGRPVMIEPDRLFDRFERLIKWSNRWMNLAKKFKPNNSTARYGKG